jgi:hypothetical protein
MKRVEKRLMKTNRYSFIPILSVKPTMTWETVLSDSSFPDGIKVVRRIRFRFPRLAFYRFMSLVILICQTMIALEMPILFIIFTVKIIFSHLHPLIKVKVIVTDLLFSKKGAK